MRNGFDVREAKVYPLGVQLMSAGLHISAVCKKNTECGILLFDRKHKDGIRIPFPADSRRGSIYSMVLKGYREKECSYLLYQGEEVFQDPYAKALVAERKYGERLKRPARCLVHEADYDWEGVKQPLTPYEDSFFYMLHVRGFTKHVSSGVHKKGTYRGVIEKIPYLQELGITAVILMPSYEFDEILIPERDKRIDPFIIEETPQVKLNYWGYQAGLYYMPKYAYAAGKDAVTEFKEMVKKLHAAGIEVVMQFYFPPEMGYIDMVEILKYWVLEYHIDGFYLMGMDIPMEMICKEPLLSQTKLLSEKDIRTAEEGEVPEYRNFALIDESFLYDSRKLLKGDGDQISNLIYHIKRNSVRKGIVNCIAKQDGFRLYDLVSYDRKHNESNGEANQDGNDYNCSWNCGVEGKTGKKSVLALRTQQMCNALTFVLLSQGTPLLYSGDEFGCTQQGNNNPYCQDNSVCWLNWNRQKTNAELLSYVRNMIALRKKHKILHMDIPLKGIDYISCGYPDISFHGREAWRPDMEPVNRSLGIMYCECYADMEEKEDKEKGFIYAGINMYWEPQVLGLPKLPKDRTWELLTSTGKGQESIMEENGYHVQVPPRTIMIYVSKECTISKEPKESKETGGKKK